MLAVSSGEDVFHQFLDDNNNEVSLAAFFILMVEELDGKRPGWREDHVLLLDNSTSHTTNLVRRVFATLDVLVVFSAPVSFKVVSV